MNNENKEKICRIACVSEKVELPLREYLTEKGYRLQYVFPKNEITGSEKYHPDLYMCKLGAEPSAEIFFGEREYIGIKYPQCAAYNGVVMGDIFIHKLTATAKDLMEIVRGRGYRLIDVPQGYTKCNMVVVDALHCITSDYGLAKALSSEASQIKVLMVEKGQVELEGYPYGFLGGASGRVDGEIVFNGDLSRHSDFVRIKEFINSCGLGVKYFKDYPLRDIGSIIAVSHRSLF